MTEPTATHTVSVETIAHYRCGECDREWSVANAKPAVETQIICRHCGEWGWVVVRRDGGEGA